MEEISEIYTPVFQLLDSFRCQNRITLLYGNHDIEKRKKNFHFMDFIYHESIILTPNGSLPQLRVFHGHQGDFLNSVLWRTARFFIRHLWAPLEVFGISNPISAAKNNHKKNKLEKKYITYARSINCYLLTGHTHRPSLCSSSSAYCNCGSCIHPQGITCIELCGNEMRLVKWSVQTTKNWHSGNISTGCQSAYPLCIKREILQSISLYSSP